MILAIMVCGRTPQNSERRWDHLSWQLTSIYSDFGGPQDMEVGESEPYAFLEPSVPCEADNLTGYRSLQPRLVPRFNDMANIRWVFEWD